MPAIKAALFISLVAFASVMNTPMSPPSFPSVPTRSLISAGLTCPLFTCTSTRLGLLPASSTKLIMPSMPRSLPFFPFLPPSPPSGLALTRESAPPLELIWVLSSKLLCPG